MSADPITCHILDTHVGKPASGVTCSVYQLSPIIEDKTDETAYGLGSDQKPFAMAKTDQDGRIKKWIVNPELGDSDKQSIGIDRDAVWSQLKPGVYKIKFLTGKYFQDLDASARTFFPFVEIHFQVDNPPDHHYHIPLLLSNHSYTTYRGS